MKLIVGILNDLWKYSIISNEWTWMSGNNTINELAIYEESNNFLYPGSRSESNSFFDGLTKRLYLFGGISHDNISICIIIKY